MNQTENLWSIPPPFLTSTGSSLPPITNRESSHSRSQRRVSISEHVQYQIQTSPIKNPKKKKETFQMTCQRENNRKALSRNQEHWMPATKHTHSVSGCAPNGMRLFDRAPSLLLSKTKKINRDQQMQLQLTKLKNDLQNFQQSANNFETGNVKSLAALSATHGKMVADMREMEQVTQLRCASRWEPGLGRRKLRASGAKLTPLQLTQR